ALASFTPTAPGPGDTFAAGSSCTIKWNADTTGGKWTDVSISLMTGSNNNMTRLATVVSGLDGTDGSLSPYSWTCPEVDPYSAIYFYQFTDGDDVQNSQWTTRFTITSASGDSEKPEHNIQPNSDPVPWGEGRLVSGVTGVSAHQQALSDVSS
ncbi:Ser-Thr-rich glycosyl-phosphatidyl-inositol-anchored membrane family-domain-containing protein, partial [Ganoderma leucocontextum]